jgi:hypothetical protein
VRENLDRASELANLTIGELHSRVQRTVDFSEKFLAQAGTLQDAALETYRVSLKSDVSTVDQVNDAFAELPVDGIARVDQVNDTFTELSDDGVSTVDQVNDASAELSVDGVWTVDQVNDAPTELSVDGVSTVDQVNDASTELSVDGVSTVDQVNDASIELSVDDFNHWKTPANPRARHNEKRSTGRERPILQATPAVALAVTATARGGQVSTDVTLPAWKAENQPSKLCSVHCRQRPPANATADAHAMYGQQRERNHTGAIPKL